jgi:hypothetical protein
MQLTWPFQFENTYLNSALKFVAVAVAAGFTGATLGITPFQNVPGEVENVIKLNAQGQPVTAIPGFPTGNYPAAFVVNFSGATPVDPNKWVQIAETSAYMFNNSWSIQQALQICDGLTPGAATAAKAA